MPSGQIIISNALTKLAINELGGTPSPSDLAAGLSELNNMWQAWGIDEGLIFAVAALQLAISANVGTYTIGAGATFNVPAPSRIYKAIFVTSAAGRIQLKIVTMADYFGHPDLLAAALAPEELYPDFNISPTTGFATLNLYPVPTVAGSKLEIEIGTPFAAWTLAGVYILPQAYQDAIEWALAWRLIPSFGAIVPTQIAETVSQEGQKAEQRLRQMNRNNRQLPMGTEELIPPQSGKAA